MPAPFINRCSFGLKHFSAFAQPPILDRTQLGYTSILKSTSAEVAKSNAYRLLRFMLLGFGDGGDAGFLETGLLEMPLGLIWIRREAVRLRCMLVGVGDGGDAGFLETGLLEMPLGADLDSP